MKKNPKSAKTKSFERYEEYKKGKDLREILILGATWEDIKWDYARGWIDFRPSERLANEAFSKLVDDMRRRASVAIPTPKVDENGNRVSMDVCDKIDHDIWQGIRKVFDLDGEIDQSLVQFAFACAANTMIDEPKGVREALASPDAPRWKEAIKLEWETLKRFGCFEVVPKSVAKKHGKLVKAKWVFKVKYEPNPETGEMQLQRYKARLVAKGFTQVPGIDFDETFSPVFSYNSLRLVFALAAANDLTLSQWDLTSSFIQQDLDVEHMYMEIPDGVDIKMPDGGEAALHCKKSIYGLKQSSRLLHERMTAFLKSEGYRQLISDQCVFTKGEGADRVIICVYVDDILMASAKENHHLREEFDRKLREVFEVSPWTRGEADWILNMKISRDWERGEVNMSQPGAIEKLAEKFGLTEGKNPATPMEKISN